ncbi:nucleotidyl transferase AbiEii/AbiGii toxin family protein [Streptomyces phaeochromogenes]|uniref:nucleotidyl transferase AbiEii/AbiGii toxin family protein n=1 Tax=Streptomyces phaeochromogenes TaxID=1923 RepID=UPI0036A5411D
MQDSDSFTKRDLLRIKALSQLAEALAPADGDTEMVAGSVALAAHLSPGSYRVPNDIDIVTRRSAEQLFEVINGLAGVRVLSAVTHVPLFSGLSGVHELVLAIGPSGGRPYDRLACQLSEGWPTGSRGTSVTYRGSAVRVETIEWVVAHKVHALLKLRETSRVSSRIRDLFDLVLTSSHSRLPAAEAIRDICTSFPEPMTTSQPPVADEWRVQWRIMWRDAGMDVDLDRAWTWLWDYWNGDLHDA